MTEAAELGKIENIKEDESISGDDKQVCNDESTFQIDTESKSYNWKLWLSPIVSRHSTETFQHNLWASMSWKHPVVAIFVLGTVTGNSALLCPKC